MERGFVLRYLFKDMAGGSGRLMCVAAIAIAGGCVGTGPVTSEPMVDYVEYMNRAAQGGPLVRQEMKREAERLSEQQPLHHQLRIGFLLTSPGEDQANTQAGEQMLREALARRTGLTPALTDLVELRLAEVEARQSIHMELRDVEGKIEELMSIESSMEKKKSESQTRPR